MPGKLFDLSSKRVYVAGHQGMVGSAVARLLVDRRCEMITASHAAVDLERQEAAESFLAASKPDVVVIAAAKVGGIHANGAYPAEFITRNLAIALNTIHGSHKAGVAKLLFLGSSCIYPRLAPQPMREEALLTGPLEATNEWYAIAKIAGIKLCQAYRRQHGADFISVMPTNLYGPGDNYHPEHSHVVPALIRRFHRAKENGSPNVTVWGTGTPLREFLYVDDLATACLFALEHYSAEPPLNVGSGEEMSIAALAELVAKVVGYHGRLSFDPSQPDGMPRKAVDSSRLIGLGWRARTTLRQGLERTYAAFLAGDRNNRLGGDSAKDAAEATAQGR